MVRVGEVHIPDIFVLLLPIFVVEGRTSCGQLIGQDAQRPNIHRPVIILVLYYFWAQVVHSPAHCFPLGTYSSYWPSEVRYFKLIIPIDQYILWLDIPVEYITLMDVG